MLVIVLMIIVNRFLVMRYSTHFLVEASVDLDVTRRLLLHLKKTHCLDKNIDLLSALNSHVLNECMR